MNDKERVSVSACKCPTVLPTPTPPPSPRTSFRTDIMDPQQSNPEEEKALAQKESQRQNILSQILSVGAKERLARIALVKPEKSRSVEDFLINEALSNRIPSVVGESQVIEILKGVSDGTTSEVKVERKVQLGGVDGGESSSDDEAGLFD